MKVKILSQKHNPLLKRTEVVFEVDHSQEGRTPSRMELRRHLADQLKAKLDLVFLEKIETKTGTMIGIGEANAYETPEQAKLVEAEHIMARNAPPEKPKEAEKPKTEVAEEATPPQPEEEKGEQREE